MTAALPMGGQKITGMADPTVSTDATTKGYTDTLVASFFSTGDVKLTIKTVADTGWLMCNDQTLGSAASGAAYSNNNNQALFLLIFNNISDTYAPIYTSGAVVTTRAAQGSAASAWAANCQIRMTAMMGRALGIAGAGGGLTSRGLGQTLGEENHTLVGSEIPGHTHSGTTGVDSPDHTHTTAVVGVLNGGGVNVGGGGSYFAPSTQNYASGGASARHAHNFTTDAGAGLGGGPHNNMQPTSFLNAMIKL